MGELIKGPWKKRPDYVDPGKVRWRRGRPLPETPKCVACQRPFNRKGWVPADLVCADCRAEQSAAALAAQPPTLFDPEDGSA